MPHRRERRVRGLLKLLASKLLAVFPRLLVTTIAVVVRVMLDRHIG